MTNKLLNIRVLTVTGYLEGVSFLLLLGVAMPLRHYLQINEPVRYIGMAHGLLFIGYLIVLLSTASKTKLPIWAMPAGVISAILPFGPFIFDRMLKSSISTQSN